MLPWSRSRHSSGRIWSVSRRREAALRQEQEEIAGSSQQQEEEILQKEAHIQETLAAIREAERILREDEEQATQSQKEKEELNRRHKSFFARRDELSQQVNLMDKECFRLTSQREKLEERQDAQTDYLWEEYLDDTRTGQRVSDGRGRGQKPASPADRKAEG